MFLIYTLLVDIGKSLGVVAVVRIALNEKTRLQCEFGLGTVACLRPMIAIVVLKARETW